MRMTIAVLMMVVFADGAIAGDFKMTNSDGEVATCSVVDSELRCSVKKKTELVDRRNELHAIERGFLKSTTFSVQGGTTNEVGSTDDGIAIPLRFDKQTDFWKLAVGWSKKKVLLDFGNIWLEMRGQETLKKGDHRWWRELLLDAVTMNLQYGFGRTAKSIRSGARNLENRSTFKVEAKYEVELDKLWGHLRQ